MALSDVCAAIGERLRLIPGIGQLTDGPPPQLVEDRTLAVYPSPGTSTPKNHTGKHGMVVFENRDNIVVQWQMKIALDQTLAFVAAATPMLDAVRDALWSEFMRSRFGGTVIGLLSIETVVFGEMGWPEPSMGFGLMLDVVHGAEASGGRGA